MYKYNNYNKSKYKAAKGPKNIPAAGSMAQNSENSDSGSVGTGEEDAPRNATGSNKSTFGLRKVSCDSLLTPLRSALLTINRRGISTFLYPRAVPLEPLLA